MHRRDWLKKVGVSSIAVMPVSVLADVSLSNDPAIQAIVGDAVLKPDSRIELHVREEAANGAVVPVGVYSQVPNTQKIVLLVDNHALSTVAELDTSHSMLAPRLSTHLQLSSACTITALVQTSSGWHVNSAPVKSLGESCEQ